MRLLATAILFSLACAAAAGEPAPGGVAANRSSGQTGATADTKRTTNPADVEALRRRILADLADKRLPVRAAAAELIVSAWPASTAALDDALICESVTVRLAAVQLLDRKELGDTRDRIKKRFSDQSPVVRTQAIRVARHLAWPEAETEFIRMLRADPVWIVRQEALRGLEVHGTKACLRTVFSDWRHEEDLDRRRRFRRVLVRVVGADHGDDVDAWGAAIESMLAGRDSPAPR